MLSWFRGLSCLAVVGSISGCNAILDNEEPRHRDGGSDGVSDGASSGDKSVSDVSKDVSFGDGASDSSMSPDSKPPDSAPSDVEIDGGPIDGAPGRDATADTDGSGITDVSGDGALDVDAGAPRPDVTLDTFPPDADGGARDADAPGDEGGGGSPPDGGSDVVDAGCTDPIACTPEAARLTAPLSTGRVTSRRPTLRWRAAVKATSYRVDLCADRACTSIRESISTTDTNAKPVSALPAVTPTFWRVVARNGAFSTSSVTWEFFVGAGNAAVDTSWLGPPDFDGNGLIDVGLGSASAQAFLMMNDPTNRLPTTPSQTLTGSASFGRATANAGDVNGDGKSDFIVGAFASGLASVFFGNATGVDPNFQSVGTGTSNFSAGVGGAGDLNGDGYADVVVSGVGGTGSTNVYLGSAAGIGATPWIMGIMGSPAAGAGDINGDGFSDVIVCSATGGGVTMYRFNAAGIFLSDLIPTPTGETASFGESCISAGDVNGDGYADVLISTSSLENAYLYYGSANGLQQTGYAKLPGGSGGGYSGAVTAIATAGDVNGDGYDDVIIGAYNANRVLVYHGGPGGISTAANTSFDTLPANAGWGFSVATAGDADGDGYADIVFAGGTSCTVDVYLHLGSSSGVSTSSPYRAWANPSGVQCLGIIAR